MLQSTQQRSHGWATANQWGRSATQERALFCPKQCFSLRPLTKDEGFAQRTRCPFAAGVNIEDRACELHRSAGTQPDWQSETAPDAVPVNKFVDRNKRSCLFESNADKVFRFTGTACSHWFRGMGGRVYVTKRTQMFERAQRKQWVCILPYLNGI